MAKRTPRQEGELDEVLAAHIPVVVKAPSKKATNKTEIKTEKPAMPPNEKRTSKSSIAETIFEETLGQERKVILNRFVSEAGLTVAGANTYLANFRKDSGLK